MIGAVRRRMMLWALLACVAGSAARAGQLPLERVEQMPRHPRPYILRDWAKVARDYDAFVFDVGRKGEHLPLIWWDDTRHNVPIQGFGLPSYVGTPHQTHGSQHEAINCIAAVVGASLVGIDKTDQRGHDFVRMCQRYFNRDNGLRLYQNTVRHSTGGTFWYETYPSLLAAQLLWLYPKTGDLERHLTTTADRMREAILALSDGEGIPDFDHLAFDYARMAPTDNGRWKEPDAAAAYGWLEYMAHVRTGDLKYLDAADRCMRFLERREANPFYEVLLPYGAVLAARMNAELGRDYDVRRLLAWCFGPSASRPGWGVIAETWGGVDASGLTGSIPGGYAFAMNTFDQLSTLAPLPRYDDRWARAIGRYLLHGASAARLFYANAHDTEHQSSADWARRHDRDSCISYEGCRRLGRRPAVASADLRTAFGQRIAEDYTATHVIGERPKWREQVLREAPVGDCDRLEHVWTIPLPETLSAWLSVEARCEDGGDADRGFRFSYATSPDGPYSPLFVVRPPDKGPSQRQKYGCGLPPGVRGTVYVKAEDTDRTAGQRRPDTLCVDALYILYEIGKSPYAMGDAAAGPPRGTATDLALYGASHVGYLGGIVRATDVEQILQIDLLRTDWFHAAAYPTFLYYNPHEEPKTVAVDVGAEARDLYETVAGRFVARGVTGRASVTIAPDSAVVVVVCPAGGTLTHEGRRTLVNGVVVDVGHPTVQIRAPSRGAWLSGRVPIALGVSVPARLSVSRVRVDLDGKAIYDGEPPPQGLAIDTAQQPDGRHVLRATVRAGGIVDRELVVLHFDNGKAAIAFDAQAIASWSARRGASAAAAVRDGRAVVTARSAWGWVVGPPVAIDFDRRPALILDVSDPDPHWVLKLRVAGHGDVYVQPDTADAGKRLLDLRRCILRRHVDAEPVLTGTRQAQFLVGAAGRQGASAAFRSIRLIYQQP